MDSLKLNTLDVFTTELFVGNPLGLVHIPEGHPITETQKQQIAAELNYSETVFLHSSNTPGSYTAQIFTPKVELPFAGHPTIGTSVWIFENLEKSDALTLNIKAGPTKLTYDRARGIASAFIPHNVRTHAKHMPWERVVAVQPALKAGPPRDCPAVSIVQGMTFLLVDLSTTPELLNDVVLSNQPIMDGAELDDSSWAASSVLSLFYKMREGAVTKIQQRMITARVTEDPATGSASCALACYLSLKRGGAGETYEYEHDQGVEMGRASQIFTKITLDATGKAVESVELRGQAVEVISGSIHLPKAQ